MPNEYDLRATITCPLCNKEFTTYDVYGEIKCPYCGAEITPLPCGDDERIDPRDIV